MTKLAVLVLSLGLLACSSAAKPNVDGWIRDHANDVRVLYGQAANLEMVLGQPEQPWYAAQLLTAVDAVLKDLPTPDPKLTTILRHMAEAYGAGAQQAASGVAVTARGFLGQGDQEFRTAKSRASQLGSDFYG